MSNPNCIEELAAYCASCNGTGLGQREGWSCWSCNGRGVIRTPKCRYPECDCSDDCKVSRENEIEE